MRITFLVANLTSGGVERTVSYLSEYFAEKGNRTTIICISGEQFYDISPRVNLVKLCIESRCVGILDRLKHQIQRFYHINKEVYKENPNVLICLDPEMYRFVSIQHAFGRFLLVTSERSNPKMDGRHKTKAKYRSFRHSDGIVFQTERAKECFPEDIRNKGTVIPNAVGNHYAYRDHGISLRRKAITAVGRLTEQKDYITLIEGFRIFSATHVGYSLEIFGDGEDKEIIDRYIEDAHLQDKVMLMGARKDALKYVETSACYVMSSKYEGMPNSLLEAMSVGVPCVSTDCEFGPAELITNGENGLLVPVGDAVELSRALSKMIDDREFAERCGNSARRVLDEQSIDAVSARYLDYIKSLCNSRFHECEDSV